jgi:general secretion pathway protein G
MSLDISDLQPIEISVNQLSQQPPIDGGALAQPAPKRARGFSLLELMMAAAVVALLMGIAIPTYRGIVERQQINRCVQDLVAIAGAIEKFRTINFSLPETLDELGAVPRVDPWGFQYRYLNFDSSAPGIKGKIRKDHNLHPLNSEFDLYSVGPDGKSSPPLTAKGSRDDVIWGRDGSFVGVASDY